MKTPDCLTCGVCCTRDAWGAGPFVTLWGADADRFTPDELAPDSVGCDFLRTKPHGTDEERCIFLTGTVGETVGCSAYNRRPRVCRDFEAGSEECHAARARRLAPTKLSFDKGLPSSP